MEREPRLFYLPGFWSPVADRGVKRYSSNIKNTNSFNFSIGNKNERFSENALKTPIERKTASKFIPTDRNFNLDVQVLRDHPAFSQPRYSKHSPKVVLSNPITGINELNMSGESFPRRKLWDYGSMVLRN